MHLLYYVLFVFPVWSESIYSPEVQVLRLGSGPVSANNPFKILENTKLFIESCIASCLFTAGLQDFRIRNFHSEGKRYKEFLSALSNMCLGNCSGRQLLIVLCFVKNFLEGLYLD